MYNPMLDRLPEDYKGWLVRTDYRIGVQIQLCISDPELSDAEKTGTALYLLYGNGVPDIQTALEGLAWFMSCGEAQTPPEQADSEPPVYCFQRDAGRIVSAFRKVFGIDISREKLHWFSFVSMLGDLSGTAFTNVIDIRTTNVSEVDKKNRAEFLRMKKRFALSDQYTPEEIETINSALAWAKSNG